MHRSLVLYLRKSFCGRFVDQVLAGALERWVFSREEHVLRDRFLILQVLPQLWDYGGCWANEQTWRPNDCFTGWLLLMELPTLCWMLHMSQRKQLLPLQRIGVMDRALTAQSVKGLLVLKWWRVMDLGELWAIPEIKADPLCRLDTRVAEPKVRALAIMYKWTFKNKMCYFCYWWGCRGFGWLVIAWSWVRLSAQWLVIGWID